MDIQDAVDKLCFQMNLPEIPVFPEVSFPHYIALNTSVKIPGTTRQGPAIAYDPRVPENLNDFELVGALAHELGHYKQFLTEDNWVFRTDQENLRSDDFHELEFGADAWAKHYGYGDNLIAALEKIRLLKNRELGFTSSWMDSGTIGAYTHPSAYRRIARLKDSEEFVPAAPYESFYPARASKASAA